MSPHEKYFENMKICILGGGAGGIGAAYFLAEYSGKRRLPCTIKVFEKLDRLGGKCHTIQSDGTYYDVGAVEITPEYELVNELIHRFGLETTPLPPAVVFNRESGAIHSYPHSLFKKGELTPDQIARFLFELKQIEPVARTPGMVPLSERFQGMSFQAWLNQIGAPLVGRLFWAIITCNGYGSLEEIPAANALKFITLVRLPEIMRQIGMSELLPIEYRQTPLEPQLYRLKLGYQNLIERMAGELQNPPSLNTKILSIKRSNAERGSISVEYRDANGNVQQESFDRLIVAIPQTLENLVFIDLGDQEREIFAKVQTRKFCSSLAFVSGLDKLMYLNLLNEKEKIGPPTDEWPLQSVRATESDGVIFYRDGHKTMDDSPQVCIQKMGGSTRGGVQNFNWDYFPRFPASQLNTMHRALEKLQGKNQTYYAGSLLNFETVEHTLSYSKSLSERIFTDKNGSK